MLGSLHLSAFPAWRELRTRSRLFGSLRWLRISFRWHPRCQTRSCLWNHLRGRGARLIPCCVHRRRRWSCCWKSCSPLPLLPLLALHSSFWRKSQGCRPCESLCALRRHPPPSSMTAMLWDESWRSHRARLRKRRGGQLTTVLHSASQCHQTTTPVALLWLHPFTPLPGSLLNHHKLCVRIMIGVRD